MYQAYRWRKSFERRKFFCVAVFATCFFSLLFAQQTKAQSKLQQFRQATRPVKCWVMAHPFIAKKTFRISQRALVLADSIRTTSTLDGNWNGGQVDAFRHGIWMAMLVQEIPERKARKLGQAYEKGNYLMFKQGKLEDGAMQDARSSQMDLLNNDAGIAVGLSKEMTADELVKAVVEAVLAGKFQKIYTTKSGEMLNCEGIILKEADWKGKWENSRCIVPSDH